ncbi:hypothetical protein ACFL5P_03135 [candidate division KSB1 bacterium]
MTEAELKKMTVKQLREIAEEKTKLTGIKTMKKDKLIEEMIVALEIEVSKKVTGEVVKDKIGAKKEINRLKHKRNDLEKGDSTNKKQLANIRRRIRNLKRMIRNAS